MAHANPDKLAYVYNSQLDAFTLYHISHETSHDAVGAGLPALGHALSGASGTAISKLITYPLDIVITRLQVQRQLQRGAKHPHYDGILDAVLKIYEREGGLQAFYSGVWQETAKGIADSFLFFLAYSYLRQRRLIARHSGKNLPVLQEIGVGVVAGAFSKFFTTPIQQIVTRKQTAAMLNHDSSSSDVSSTDSVDIAREIFTEKGLKGFWSGYSASLVLTLNPSITMLLHKALIRLVVPRAERSDPGAQLTFLLAAISKALASTVTYPFSLAKTRAQISSQKPTATVGETSEKDKMEIPVGSKAARARQNTVFATILRIAQAEGLWALYEGLGAEVLKGFFSHGITMLMKDRVHTAIISLYYTVARAFERYPSPHEVAKNASDEVKEAYERGKAHASEAYEKSSGVVTKAAGKVREGLSEGSQQAHDLVTKGKDNAKEAYSKGVEVASAASSAPRSAAEGGAEQVCDMCESGKEAASSAYHRSGELAERGKGAARNAAERAKEAVLQAEVRDIDGPDDGFKE